FCRLLKIVYVDNNVILSLHPRNKLYLILVNDFSSIFLDFICYYFVEEFCIKVHERYWPIVFFCSVFIWFWYRGIAIRALLAS
uniref:Uncharacterized protein n=1 Tax=Canis lupus dingo TaxID=286419 RepID=A0A8C0K409_CANLU